jgi:peptide/nickel transport system substrate-binding protein
MSGPRVLWRGDGSHRPTPVRRGALAALLAAATLLAGCTAASPTPSSGAGSRAGGGAAPSGNGTLIIAMSAGDIPSMDTPPDQGLEGYRFVGNQLYDPLVRFDVGQGDHVPDVIPALAESWTVSPAAPTTWTFHLRQGVRFHDGTPLTADAVVYQFNRIKRPDSADYDALNAGAYASRTTFLESWRAVDDLTVEITTGLPYAFLPYDLAYLYIPSPAAVKQWGKDYAQHPVGTGPFRLSKVTERQSLELERNDDYWGAKPKVQHLILRPMPDASARLAALLAGEVQWAEVPPPESINSLKQQGFQVQLKAYPHVWPYILNLQRKPFDDLRVRQALNYAIDRQGMCEKLLAGACTPATSWTYKGHPAYGDPAVYTYDPERARRLLAEAGSPNGFSMKLLTPASGSGNMWPIPMNEFVQQNFAAIGVKLNVETIDWNLLRARWRAGFVGPDVETDAIMFSSGGMEPATFTRSFYSGSAPPRGANIGLYRNPEVDRLLEAATREFDRSKMWDLLGQVDTLTAADAVSVYIVHDLNLRALSPKVKGFVQPQSWFVDLIPVSVES